MNKARVRLLENVLRRLIQERGCVGCLLDPPPFVRGKDTRWCLDEHAADCVTRLAVEALGMARP
jgi:hypothetical protein